MHVTDILRQRLHNHHLEGPQPKTAVEVVQWLGAVQAQDYLGASWAIAQRTPGLTAAAVDQAFAAGSILRTHLMRPTWHFVVPADLRWLLELTAPRINALTAYYYRQLELDDKVFARTNAIIAEALQGGRYLTRAELGIVLTQAGVDVSNLLRLTHIAYRAELDAVICSGPLKGKQHTYALLSERVPAAASATLSHDQALAELARRYFTSHGPATLADYTWWSGLTATAAKAGLQAVQSELASVTVGDQVYWYNPAVQASLAPPTEPTIHLLPNYDEYVVAYTDRTPVFDPGHVTKLDSRGNPLFNNVIVQGGRIIGTWKRTIKKHEVVVEPNPFVPLTAAAKSALVAAVERYGQYLNLPVAK